MQPEPTHRKARMQLYSIGLQTIPSTNSTISHAHPARGSMRASGSPVIPRPQVSPASAQQRRQSTGGSGGGLQPSPYPRLPSPPWSFPQPEALHLQPPSTAAAPRDRLPHQPQIFHHTNVPTNMPPGQQDPLIPPEPTSMPLWYHIGDPFAEFAPQAGLETSLPLDRADILSNLLVRSSKRTWGKG